MIMISVGLWGEPLDLQSSRISGVAWDGPEASAIRSAHARVAMRQAREFHL